MIRLLPLAALLAGCVPATLPTSTDIGPTRGAALFAEGCVGCHAADGTGGVGPDLTTISTRAGGQFPRDRVLAQIDGLGRHGDPDAVMPEFGAGDLGQTVIVEDGDGTATPIPADLLALAAYLRSIQR
ncbi:MAG: cytochrome c [Jannaschia sp.]